MRRTAFLFFVVSALAIGCTPTTEPVDGTASEPVTNADPAKQPSDTLVGSVDSEDHEGHDHAKEDASKPTSMSPVAHTNDKGEIVCPVMGAVTTEKDAVGYQDYEGVRYYFCCGDCPKAFKKDPARWIKK
jgi:Cu+-exporting ATPase